MFGQRTVDQGWFVKGRLVNGRLVKQHSNEEMNVRRCETY